MAKQLTQYQVFFSSTMDLDSEFETTKKVIEELNKDWGKQNNCTIDLINYRTHCAPGISTGSPQNLINSDIGDQYDLYIGVLWKRFGTPTDKALSGTEEEFNIAYDRYINSPNTIQVLFYFSNTPTPLSEIDSLQLQKIIDFKNRLKNLNVLYQEYSDISDFEKYLKIHIPQRLIGITTQTTDIIKRSNIQIDQTPVELLVKEIENEEIEIIETEELGIIEYGEIFNAANQELIDTMIRITHATKIAASQQVKRAKQLTQINESGIKPHMPTVKGIIRTIAKSMVDYGEKIESELQTFSISFESMINASINIINLQDPTDIEYIIERKKAIIELRQTNCGLKFTIDDNVNTINSIAPVTGDIIKSKRFLKQKLNLLSNAINTGTVLLTQLIDRYESAERKLLEQ